MSTSLPFERVKKIKLSYKCVVYGFVRNCQSLFDSKKAYYQIPENVIYAILLFYYDIIESSILSENESDILIKLFKEYNKFDDLGNYHFNLIFRGSRDGFDESSFVSQCHDRQNLLIIIENDKNTVFGAYTSTGWKGTNPSSLNETEDKNAFLFVIRTSENLKAIIVNPEKNRCGSIIASYNGYYCYFGRSFWLKSNCDNYKGSGSTLSTYNSFKPPDAKYFQCIGTDFMVRDFEVFQLQN